MKLLQPSHAARELYNPVKGSRYRKSTPTKKKKKTSEIDRMYRPRYNRVFQNTRKEVETDDESYTNHVRKGKQGSYVPDFLSHGLIIDTQPDGFDKPDEILKLITNGEIKMTTLQRYIPRNAVSLKGDPSTWTPEQKREAYRRRELLRKNWSTLALIEIPKAVRHFEPHQKSHFAHCEKISNQMLREMVRRCGATHRALREVPVRARRLTREILAIVRNKDPTHRNTAATSRRKKEEIERDRIREKKKLEFLLSQTEIFAHFMSNTMGLNKKSESPSKADHDRSAVTAARNYINTQRAQTNRFNSSKRMDMVSDMDLLNPSTMPSQQNIEEPIMFNGKLKSYQLKGLNWLVNLYEQGINGILADEMGLGKTVQAIAFVCHLAEVHDVWGPTVIIAPNSVVHQWCSEFARFAPSINVLPYWGAQKDRELLRRFWRTGDGPTADMHVLVTPYSTYLQDEKYFHKMKWQYMFLDEAQAIKSAQTLRWKTLLKLKCRNRLLLTGTPIQNSMMELWSLLHFIMPGLFDNPEEFQRWFADDVEAHASGSTSNLSSKQIQRLHQVLKPFMLRRVKSDVEAELAPKVEKVIRCDLSPRQKSLYIAIRDQLMTDDLQRITGKNKDLLNIVMQFRKVCNHPEVFKQREVESPFLFVNRRNPILPSAEEVTSIGRLIHNPLDWVSTKLLCSLELPGWSNDDITKSKLILRKFSIWDPGYLAQHLAIPNLLQALSPTVLSSLFFASLAQKVIFQSILNQNKPSDLSNLWDLQMRMTEFGHLRNAIGQIEPKVIARPPMRIVSDVVITERDKRVLQSWEDLFNLEGVLFGHRHKFVWKHLPNTTKLFRRCGGLRNYVTYPHAGQLLADSGKLKVLDKLLKKLHRDGHRVLIFSQMTKMLDVLEGYLSWRRYKFFRLDGQTLINERREMVRTFQSDPDYFVFMLSTRAGGLGINLTAADTVIFYDNDWNPTMDAQAQDRCHRIGQKKQVTVYRMICRNTIEERILSRAQHKFAIQKTVYSGGFKMEKDNIFKTSELKDILFA